MLLPLDNSDFGMARMHLEKLSLLNLGLHGSIIDPGILIQILNRIFNSHLIKSTFLAKSAIGMTRFGQTVRYFTVSWNRCHRLFLILTASVEIYSSARA